MIECETLEVAHTLTKCTMRCVNPVAMYVSQGNKFLDMH